MEPDLTLLPLKDNSIIVWRTDNPSDDLELSQAVGALGCKNCWLVRLRPGEDLTVLDDEELDRIGLQRKEPEVR